MRVFFLLLFSVALPLNVNGAGLPGAVLFLEHNQPAPWTEILSAAFVKGGQMYGYATKIIIVAPGEDQKNAFRKAASESELVIVATDNFHEILRDNAANFRRVRFGCLDAGIRAPNIMSVTFADEQAAYLAGVAASMYLNALFDGDAALGWLSGADTPALRSLFNGFYEGAKLANPQTRVIQAVAGSFIEPELAASKTEWLIDSGAKVIALASGYGNSGAIPALNKRALAINLDHPESAAPAFGTIVKALDKAVLEIMASAASDKFRGKEIVVYDLANKGVDFGYANPASGGKALNADISRRIAELRREIINGNIRLHSLRQRALCDCLD